MLRGSSRPYCGHFHSHSPSWLEEESNGLVTSLPHSFSQQGPLNLRHGTQCCHNRWIWGHKKDITEDRK